MTPESSRRAPRPPITSSMLDILHDDLDLRDPFDAAVFSAATCVFWTQLRLGESLSDRVLSFDATHVPCRRDLKPASTPMGSRGLHLPWTKTTGSRGADVFICRQRGKSDPIAALDNHLRINDVAEGEPLFSFTGRGGSQALTRKNLLSRCNEIWSTRGFPILTGHSFRIGGTTELLIRGVPALVVRAMGRWSSDAFLRYWRSLDLLAPLYTELLPLKSRRILEV
ncbi:hypothetical protein PLICRDRAFT_176861 [Plicaturopsis crispa FD-325 SS-3]|nr:hypothetical protein PLICRDRAFT_176861 [Plicaturopsis crispa FD-325 SS-3]